MESLYHSILTPAGDIHSQLNDNLAGSYIREWCSKNGLPISLYGRGWEYDDSTHTITIFTCHSESLDNMRRIIQTIDNRNGRRPEMTWSILGYFTEDDVVHKPVDPKLYSLGLSVDDIHINFVHNPLDNRHINYVGELDESNTKKSCTDIEQLKYDVITLNIIPKDGWSFDSSNLGNISNILPDIKIDNIFCPNLDIKAQCKGIPARQISTYYIDNKSKGFMFGEAPVFARSADKVIINPDIDKDELMKYFELFAKNNPQVSIIHTVRAQKKVDLFINQSVKEKTAIFTTK